jgi:AcrR family transcriptional regulator
MASDKTPPEAPAVEPPPKSQPRVRLEVDARRAQLLEIGRELFTTRNYDELSVDEIAQAAGISKGLLYHYFPGKRVFYIESLREAAEELLRQTMPPKALAPLERLRAGIDAYLTYVDQHRPVFAALSWRGSLHDDRDMIRIVEQTRRRFFDRLCTELADSPIEHTALRGWIGFIEASVLDWVERSNVSRRQLSDLFIAVFQQCLAQPSNPR